MSRKDRIETPGDAVTLLQCGLGPLGLMTLRLLLTRPEFKLVGVVDKDPALVGRKLDELLGGGATTGLWVQDDLQAAVASAHPDVCLIMTVSDLIRIESQVAQALAGGAHVVSTCEELIYPWARDAAAAGRIHRRAIEAGRAVLGTGVNPGFLMDFLPQTLTALCHRVDALHISRYQDASCRRLPFQRKIGAGLSPEAFAARVQEGVLRHVGLVESIHLIASQLGWKLDRTEDIIEPILAFEPWEDGLLSVPVGHALGVRQTGRGFSDGHEVITLDFRAAVGFKEPQDRIRIEGEPRIDSIIAGGVNGDTATCSLALNACRSILRSAPGLQDMATQAGLSWHSGAK